MDPGMGSCGCGGARTPAEQGGTVCQLLRAHRTSRTRRDFAHEVRSRLSSSYYCPAPLRCYPSDVQQRPIPQQLVHLQKTFASVCARNGLDRASGRRHGWSICCAARRSSCGSWAAPLWRCRNWSRPIRTPLPWQDRRGRAGYSNRITDLARWPAWDRRVGGWTRKSSLCSSDIVLVDVVLASKRRSPVSRRSWRSLCIALLPCRSFLRSRDGGKSGCGAAKPAGVRWIRGLWSMPKRL